MSQQPIANTSRVRMVTGTFGAAQIVVTPDRVLIDLQTRNHDASGVLRKDHAQANMPLATASRLRDLLNEAIASAAEAPMHQPGLWSEATSAHSARRLHRNA
nr:hypothetical protein [uncultured Rhodopila sp.]